LRHEIRITAEKLHLTFKTNNSPLSSPQDRNLELKKSFDNETFYKLLENEQSLSNVSARLIELNTTIVTDNEVFYEIINRFLITIKLREFFRKKDKKIKQRRNLTIFATILWSATTLKLVTTNPITNLLSDEKRIKASEERHPLNSIGDPKALARVIYGLLSAKDNWITGQTISVDGGLSTIR
jgi:hypothetical protein